MNYKILILLIFLASCAQNYSKSNVKKQFNSKGFAYIYNHEDYEKKIIKKKIKC